MKNPVADFSVFNGIHNTFENLDINEEECIICEEIKNREIFWLASSLEKLTKALLPAFGVILVGPVFMSKKQKNLDNNKKMEIGEALTNIILIPFDNNEAKRIWNQAVSKSKLVDLINLKKEILKDKLKKIYNTRLN